MQLKSDLWKISILFKQVCNNFSNSFIPQIRDLWEMVSSDLRVIWEISEREGPKPSYFGLWLQWCPWHASLYWPCFLVDWMMRILRVKDTIVMHKGADILLKEDQDHHLSHWKKEDQDHPLSHWRKLWSRKRMKPHWESINMFIIDLMTILLNTMGSLDPVMLRVIIRNLIQAMSPDNHREVIIRNLIQAMSPDNHREVIIRNFTTTHHRQKDHRHFLLPTNKLLPHPLLHRRLRSIESNVRNKCQIFALVLCLV